MLARREIVKGLAGLPLAAILASPSLSYAAAAALENVSIATAGGRKVNAALARPKTSPAAAIMLIHEWWGLNDQIKAVAAELAKEGYLALAIDLYDGKVATVPADARSYMKGVQRGEGIDTVKSWGAWLQRHDGSNGKLGTVGWCFGGGWSLNASLARPVAATVVYYGRVNRTAADLASLQGPVLGHFATRDQWINRDMVGGFERAMDAAGKAYEVHWYEADHAFANPTGARYDAPDAAKAWQRTLAFLKEHLA